MDLNEHEKIISKSSEHIYKKISENRSLGNKRADLLNLSAIYFPAVISVFEQIAQKDHAHSSKSWFSAIIKALDEDDRESLLGMEEENIIDPLEFAQKLLDNPFLKATKEIIEDDSHE